MEHRRTGAAGCAALLLTLAACGAGSDDATGVADEAATTASPSDDGSSDGESTKSTASETADPSVDDTADPTPPPAPDPTAEQDPAAPVATESPDAAAPVTESRADESRADESPVAETASPVAAEPVLGGRLFAAEVQPEAELDTNPFPDLVVDDIGKDAEVNIRNILPSDRPVLLWAWAPH